MGCHCEKGNRSLGAWRRKKMCRFLKQSDGEDREERVNVLTRQSDVGNISEGFGGEVKPESQKRATSWSPEKSAVKIAAPQFTADK